MKLKKTFRWFLATFLMLISTPVFAESTKGNPQTDFCTNPRIKTMFKIGGTFIYIMKVLIPVVIIVLGSVDLFKAFLSGDEKDVSTATQSLIKRFVIGIVIFFVPTVIKTIFNIVDGSKEDKTSGWIFDSECYNCLFDPYASCNIPKSTKSTADKETAERSESSGAGGSSFSGGGSDASGAGTGGGTR